MAALSDNALAIIPKLSLEIGYNIPILVLLTALSNNEVAKAVNELINSDLAKFRNRKVVLTQKGIELKVDLEGR